MNEHAYGYPEKCTDCRNVGNGLIELKARPYLREGGGLRLMLLGQDPNIRKKRDRVSSVLMLNDEKSQLYKWLQGVFGEEFTRLTLYASNAVKCHLPAVPGEAAGGPLRFLSPYFAQCKRHLLAEVQSFQPEFVITLGETAHRLLIALVDSTSVPPPKTMKQAFTGQFLSLSVAGVKFRYSPCLHIATFRVAETYGEAVKNFKTELAQALRSGRGSLKP